MDATYGYYQLLDNGDPANNIPPDPDPNGNPGDLRTAVVTNAAGTVIGDRFDAAMLAGSFLDPGLLLGDATDAAAVTNVGARIGDVFAADAAEKTPTSLNILNPSFEPDPVAVMQNHIK